MPKNCTKYTDIGGQAVLEGVMMRSPRDEMMAIAVRKENGEIVVESQRASDPAKKNKFYALPVVRGVVRFVAMLTLGYDTISMSAKMYGLEDEEPSKFEKWLSKTLGKSIESIVMGFAIVLAAVLAIGLFVFLPSFTAQLFKGAVHNRIAVNLIEGLARMVIFLLYMSAISMMKDIRRVFMYHGAEHKTIACFEAGQELTAQNAMGFPRQHPRCGTSFLLIVMVISILFFSVVGWDYNLLTRVLSRLLLMPLVAGVSYEALMYLGKHDNAFVRAVRAPGMWLQNLTTREPDAAMIEVAITAFHAASCERFKNKDASQGKAEKEEDVVSVQHEGIAGAAQG